MEDKSVSTEVNEFITNIFKNGRIPTKEEYTQAWIKVINQIERNKAHL